MKKILLLLCFSFAIINITNAQRAAERKEEIKQGLKNQVKLSDAQIVAVMSLEDVYRTKLRAIKSDVNLSAEQKKQNTAVVNEEKNAKIMELLGKEKLVETQKFYSELKKTKKGNTNEIE